MQTAINYLFAVLLGIAAGYGLARVQERMRHRRIWKRVVAELQNDES